MVTSATEEQTTFDREYANRILREVIQVDRNTMRMRNIVSYLTLPIGVIPVAGTLLQKVIEEVAGKYIERKARKQYGWFYFISDLSRLSANEEKSRQKEIEKHNKVIADAKRKDMEEASRRAVEAMRREAVEKARFEEHRALLHQGRLTCPHCKVCKNIREMGWGFICNECGRSFV
jgi:hypothetical protein